MAEQLQDLEDMTKFGGGLQKLPPELLVMIFSELPTPHLKALRPLCRAFEPFAAQCLFHTLILAPRKRQLRVWSHVAHHPVLGQYPKCLHYDLSTYRDSNLRAIRETYLREGPRLSEHDRLIGSYHTLNLFRDQEYIVSNNLEAKVLAETLPKLRNLRTISLSCDGKCPYRSSKIPPLRPQSLTPIPMKEGYGRDSTLSHALQLLFGAFTEAKVADRPLSVSSLSFEWPTYNSVGTQFDYIRERHLKSANSFYANLTSVRVPALTYVQPTGVHSPLSFPLDFSQPQYRSNWIATHELLRSAKNLRHLCLYRAEIFGPPRPTYPSYSNPVFVQLPEPTWPYLQSVRLEFISLTTSQILDFVNQHKKTLESVYFDNVALFTGTWNDVASSLSAILEVDIIYPKLVRCKKGIHLLDGSGAQGRCISCPLGFSIYLLREDEAEEAESKLFPSPRDIRS